MKNQEIKFYPKETLQLLADVPGARQWAVSLANHVAQF